MKKKKGVTISIGELIDRLSIVNLKVWHVEEKIAKTIDKNEKADLGDLIRCLNRERADLREEINQILEGKKRGTNKIEYVKIGRGK